jgi:hypothetical protein
MLPQCYHGVTELNLLTCQIPWNDFTNADKLPLVPADRCARLELLRSTDAGWKRVSCPQRGC